MKKKPSSTVEIKFDNPEAAEHFISWLCGSGEQHYWDWMLCREDEEDGDITAVRFDYNGGTTKASEFGKNPIIAECSRLTKPIKKK
jgi:hypothetical protein